MFTNLRDIHSISFTFRYPQKNQILIYDELKSEFFKKYFKNYTVYSNRFYKSTLVYLPFLLKCILRLNFSFSNYKKYFIEYVDPKIIITLNENQLGFFETKKLFPKKIFIAIQGNWKFDVDHDIIFFRKKYKKKKLKCDYFFCYNDRVIQYYKKFIDCKNYIKIGSFDSNIFPIRKKTEKGLITFISQFKLKKDNDIWHKKYKFSDWRMNEKFFLQKLEKNLCKKNTLTILGKTSSIEEYNYYKKIFNNNFNFVYNDKLIYSSKKKIFDYIDRSELIITLDSTLGYQALKRGKKVFFFSIRDSIDLNTRSKIRFCWPEKKTKRGLNWSSSYSKKEINRMIELKKMANKSWIKFYKSEFKSTCYYNKDNAKFTSTIKKLKIDI